MIKKKAVLCTIILYVLIFASYVAIVLCSTEAVYSAASSVVIGVAMYYFCRAFYKWLIKTGI